MTDSPALAQVLSALGDRVAPVSMALERTLPVPDDCRELFAEGGLVRGRVLSCVGPAATTMALRVVSAAVDAGGWLAVIDLPTLGLDAASELGVALERVVAIDTTRRSSRAAAEKSSVDGDTGSGAAGVAGAAGGAIEAMVEADPGVWADAVAAAADGFEVLLTRVPAGVRPATMRKVSTRLQQRGVVMMVIGDPGALVCDGVLDTGQQVWSGLGAGWGSLQHRSVDVTATGRRLPGRRCRTLEFPVPESLEAQLPAAQLPAAQLGDTQLPETQLPEVQLSNAS